MNHNVSCMIEKFPLEDADKAFQHVSLRRVLATEDFVILTMLIRHRWSRATSASAPSSSRAPSKRLSLLLAQSVQVRRAVNGKNGGLKMMR